MGTRDGIVGIAQKLFAEQGYKATSIAQISRAAGLSPSAGGLYRHFKTKELLLEAVVELALQRFNDSTKRREATAGHLGSPLEELRANGGYILADIRKNIDLHMLVERELHDFEALQERVRTELLLPIIQGIEDWLVELMPQHSASRGKSRALAELAWNGLAYRAIRADGGIAISDEEYIDAWATAIYASIAIEEPRK